jgi:hypothetical protein
MGDDFLEERMNELQEGCGEECSLLDVLRWILI